jgi:hypothetical protein
MNKKSVFTGTLLLMLLLVLTGCRLPASGNPPVLDTPVPLEPTATTGTVAEPTNTSVPPTPVVATPTSAPPTAEPPTPVPPTPVPPTPVPLPQASRIQFVVGGTSTSVSGEVDAGQTFYYVLQASATQTMNLKVQSPNGDVYLEVLGADRTVLLNSSDKETIWSATLPSTQDYFIGLKAGGDRSSYTLSVEIPPLQAGPTANITPQPGSFNPVAQFGSPTFSDPMNGTNINDWTNPATGLLPDTSFIRISLTDQRFYMTGKQEGFSTWYFTWHELSDFYLQSTFDSGSCTGKDAFGLIIRGPEHLAGESYGYVVAFSCDGSYWVFRIDSASPYTSEELISWKRSEYIASGAGKQNVMGIKAVGDTLTIYANGHQVAEVTDDEYGVGRYGLFVSPEFTENYTFRVVEMSYWDLSE